MQSRSDIAKPAKVRYPFEFDPVFNRQKDGGANLDRFRNIQNHFHLRKSILRFRSKIWIQSRSDTAKQYNTNVFVFDSVSLRVLSCLQQKDEGAKLDRFRIFIRRDLRWIFRK